MSLERVVCRSVLAMSAQDTKYGRVGVRLDLDKEDEEAVVSKIA